MSPNLFDKIIKNVKINLHLNINDTKGGYAGREVQLQCLRI